jgi:alanyl-tRNA synthetase
MSTIRLYYDRPDLRAFDATVVRVEPRGAHAAVWLDRTAFYPSSGGQPFDTGTLGQANVVGVADDEAGDVVHLVEGTAPAPGSAVHGAIDWVRRFDHMQQHTGQHVLSAVLEHMFGAHTVGFHLGSDASTIDLDRELVAGQISAGELEANRAVWRDAPVSIRYASQDEARTLPLRKEPVRSGTLRLIDIAGVDLSACGGTHVERTGAIGQVAIAGWERFKGGQRLEFVCGGRALARFQQLRDVSAASIRLLSVLPGELPAAIERLQAELKGQRRAVADLQSEVAKHEAEALARSAEALPIGPVVLRIADGDATRLKALASAAAASGVIAVLASRNAPALAVAASAAGLHVPCDELIGSLAREFGGRGGGRPELAQCGGLDGSPERILASARAWLLSRTGPGA